VDRTFIEQAVRYSEQASHRERMHILGLEALLGGELAAADSILTQLADAYPEDVLAWTMLATVALRQNQVSEAITMLDQAILFNPVHKTAINLQAYLYQQVGDLDRAIATVDDYIAMVPGEPNPYDTKGDILSSSGRIDEAIENYQTVRSIKPDFDDYGTALELGELYKYRGDYDSARACFQDGATNGGTGGRSSARTSLALLPLYRGHLAEGWRVLADGMGADRLDKASAPGHGPGQKNHFVAAMVHLGIGEFDQAAERLALVIEISQTVLPDDSLRYRALQAFALASAGRDEAADSIIDQLERHRNDGDFGADVYQIGRGFVGCARGEWAFGVEQLNRVSESTRDGFSIRFWLGRALFETGAYSAAAAEFSSILDDYADPFRSLMALWDAQTHYYLARSYEAAGEPEASIEQFELFVDLWSTADSTLQPMADDARRRAVLLKQGLQ
jgi:tetratricopeptide (TPR) repeat protein